MKRLFIFAYCYWLLWNLKRKYKTSMPRIKFKKILTPGVTARLEYDENKRHGTIRIDLNKSCSYSDIKRSLYHEFRHLWQWTYFYEVSKWWFNILNIHENDPFYYNFSMTEYDAIRFAKSSGEKDDCSIMSLYTVTELNSMYKAKNHIEFIMDIGRKLPDN